MVLYGDSHLIELLIHRFQNFRFLGVLCLDNSISEPALLPITLDEAQEADLIIIIERKSSIQDAFNNLFHWAKKHNIFIYDISGQNLYETLKYTRIEDKYISNFRKHFIDYIDQKIVIYGKGKKAQQIITGLTEFNIIGILDKDETEGYFYGKPILKYEDAYQLESAIIIIAAKKENMLLIYERIKLLEKIHLIPIFCDNGIRAQEYIETKMYLPKPEHPYFSVNEDYFKEHIHKHDVIIFSLFEVLFLKKTLTLNDFFILLEREFSNYYLHGNDIVTLRKNYLCDYTKNIYDIYNEIQTLTGISDDIKQKLLDIEIDLQNKILVQRNAVFALLDYAIIQYKEIYLIEDTELPSSIWNNILKAHNITAYKKMYLSNEYKTSKNSGLYQIIKEDLGKKRALHIGVSKYKDCYPAIDSGINALAICDTIELLSLSHYADLRLMPTNINERFMLKLFAIKMFDNPFILYQSKGKVTITNFYDYIYAFIAPIIVSYIPWLVNMLKEEHFDGILFASRDGYLIAQLYNKFKEKFDYLELPEGIYFYTSRKAASNAALKTDADICRLFALPYEDNPEIILKDKFGFSPEEILDFNTSGASNLIEYALLHKEIIFKRSKEFRRNYRKYIKNIGIKDNGKYAFFDLGTSGTTLLYLKKFVSFSIIGMPFFWYDVPDDEKKMLPISPMYLDYSFAEYDSYHSYILNHYMLDHYVFLEPLITSLEPSLKGFNTDGYPIFASEDRSNEELERIKVAKKAIEDYYQDYIDNLYVLDSQTNLEFIQQLFIMGNSEYTDIRCKMLDNYFNRDDLGAQKIKIQI